MRHKNPSDGVALRRRTRLMAEYAAGKRCVRMTAGGFSPDFCALMPRRKARRELHFQNMLESAMLTRHEQKRRKTPEYDARKKRESLRRSAKTKEKRHKNRKKENNSAPVLFGVEIMGRLVYCNMVFFAMRNAEKRRKSFERKNHGADAAL